MTCFCPNKSVFWISSRLYKKPPQPSESEIASASNGFYLAVKSPLKSNAVKVQHTCKVYIGRAWCLSIFFNYKGISSRDSKYTMLSLEDFNKLSPPYYWWYISGPSWPGKGLWFSFKDESLPWKLTKAFRCASRETSSSTKKAPWDGISHN